jgi:hypothetical protein
MDDEDILFDFSMPITEETIEDVKKLSDLLDSFEFIERERVENAKFNSYIQIRIRAYNKKRDSFVESLDR